MKAGCCGGMGVFLVLAALCAFLKPPASVSKM